MKLVAKYAIAPSAMSTTTTMAIQMGAPERKATRELVKPGGLSGELPAGTPVPFTLWNATTILVRRRSGTIKSGN
jgi:hypothetical protein